jgi:glycosyltransferase involved in cell wall biosynthesis
MKILWLSHFVPYPPKGGQLQRSHNLLKQAAKRHDVHLVSLNQKNLLSTPENIKEANDELSKICRRVEFFPITSDRSIFHWYVMTALNYFSSLPYDCKWLYNKKLHLFLKNLSIQGKFDLIHIDTIGMFQYVLLFPQIPIVLNHHNIESSMMSRRVENESNKFKRFYFLKESEKLKEYERNVCPKCTMNLVVSDLDALRLKENVGSVNIAVVSNGVDLEYFQPQNPVRSNDGGFIFAGTMDWYPNRAAVLFFLSEILPKLREDNIDLPVTIVGKNPFKELIAFAEKDSQITAPGFVNDVRPYLDSANIYVCPIHDGGGTRLKILDALAMGKTLVATGLAVEGLDLVEEEHYLRAESASDFVVQIKRLINDNNLSSKISLQGRRFIENVYSWEIIGEKMDYAYQKAVSATTS